MMLAVQAKNGIVEGDLWTRLLLGDSQKWPMAWSVVVS